MPDVPKQRQRAEASPRKRAVWVYFARFGDLVKIGATCNPLNRFKQLKRPEFLFGFYAPAGFDCGYEMESAYHRHFKDKLVRGYEYYRLSDSDLAEAKNLRLVCGIGDPPIVTWPSCECHPRLGIKFNWQSLPKRLAIRGLITPKRPRLPSAEDLDRIAEELRAKDLTMHVECSQ